MPVAAINNLTDPVAVINAVATLAPSTPDLVAPLVTFQGTREFDSLWISRLDDILCNGVSLPSDVDPANGGKSYCRVNEPRSGWWVKGFGYFGNQEDHGQVFGGYNSRILGGAIGYDMPTWLDGRVGVDVGYANSKIDGARFGSTTGFDTYEATVYILQEFGAFYVSGDLSVGLNDYTGTRHIAFPGFDRTAHAGYNGEEYTGLLNAGYRSYVEGFTVTPLASLQYSRINLDSYGETGAGAVDLNVHSQSYDFLESGLGVKVSRDFASEAGTFVPEVHFKWLRALNNPKLQNTAAFAVPGSPTFTTPGLKTADDTLDAGLSVTLLSNGRKWAVEAGYDYEWRSDNYSAQQGIVKFTYRFGGEATDVCDCAVPAPVPVVAAAQVPKSYLVFFDFDRSDLTPEAVGIVADAARNAGPAHVTEIDVTGHTDTVGSDAYNMRLSRRRAESVASRLENDGIPASQIAIFAKGKRDLLVPTGDGVKEPQNRRVQIVYAGGPPA